MLTVLIDTLKIDTVPKLKQMVQGGTVVLKVPESFLLHVLSVSVWVFSGRSGFLPQLKLAHRRERKCLLISVLAV